MCKRRSQLLFVYGTLLEMDNLMRSIVKEDQLEGFELYSLGPYPCIIEGSGTVKGKVIIVNKSMLASIRQYEGSLYAEKDVVTKGGTPCKTFVWNHKIPTDCKKIENGDWLHHTETNRI